MIWLGGALVVLAGSALAVASLRHRYVYARITSGSMAPTYRPGERVLVRRVAAGRVRAGDVVVICRPVTASGLPARSPTGRLADGDWVVKRVVAVPGDPVPRDRFPALRHVGHDVVPPGRLVVLGDAGERSQDSKQLGYFRFVDLLGVVPRGRVRY